MSKNYGPIKILSAASSRKHNRNLQDATRNTPQHNLRDMCLSLFFGLQTHFLCSNFIFLEDLSPQITSPHCILYPVSLMLFRNHNTVLFARYSYCWKFKGMEVVAPNGMKALQNFFSKSANLFQVLKWVKTLAICKNIFLSD